jgi:hypothetical protein
MHSRRKQPCDRLISTRSGPPYDDRKRAAPGRRLLIGRLTGAEIVVSDVDLDITMSGGASYGATLHRFQGAEIHGGQEIHNGPVAIASLITN